MRSLLKLPTQLCGTNFCINCTSSDHFALSLLRGTEFRFQRGGLGAFVVKNIRRDFVARTFALIAPVQPILHRVSCSNEIVPNAPKHYGTHQNMSLGPDGVDRVDLLEKNSNGTLWLELLH